MPRTRPENLTRPKHPDTQRDAMEDIQELRSTPNSGEISYREPNRDRALGEADRTGRHFDELIDVDQDQESQATDASEDHEAD
jgi:hypothetical protein